VVRVRGKKRPNKQAAFCMATVGINILSTKKYIQRYILFRYIFRVS
jgi:hypothetical protein